MSTQKWSDDDLDDFFRKSAEESDPAYDPAAWQDLQTRLNDRDRTLLRNSLLRWGLPALLLLLFIGSILWYNNRSVPTGIAAKTNEHVAKTTPKSKTRKAATDSPNTSIHQQPATHGQSAIPVSASPEKGLVTDSEAKLTDEKRAIDPPADKVVTALTPGTARRNAGMTHTNKTGHKPMDTYQTGTTTDQRTNLTHTKKVPPVGVDHGAVADRPAELANGHERRLSTNRRTMPSTSTRITRTPASRTTNKNPEESQLTAHAARRAPVAGRRAGYLTSTARQDATFGGLGHQRSVVSGLVHTSAGDKNTDGVSAGTADYYSPVSSSVLTTRGVAADDAERFVWPTVSVLPARPVKWAESSVSLPEPESAKNTDKMARPTHFRFPGLSVQLVVSPDLSSVGFNNFDRPGSNLGVMFQYQLSERFSVQAGALWSTKLYKSTSMEYHFPVYVHVLPESITGKCTMFDIPLNLRYDVLLRPGGAMRGPRRWFISGGVTSYFIDHEAYTYNYANPNDPAIGTMRGWDNKAAGRKGGSFGLSNLNVSIGYEQPVSRRLSWQIEPFMKLPLQEIGYFKVRLLSTGAFLSVRYRL